MANPDDQFDRFALDRVAAVRGRMAFAAFVLAPFAVLAGLTSRAAPAMATFLGLFVVFAPFVRLEESECLTSREARHLNSTKKR